MVISRRKKTIGVLAVQGDVSEHVNMLKKNSPAVLVRSPQDLAKTDALIMPGGESTAISKILVASGLQQAILARVTRHTLPILGTCAGCVLLAKIVTSELKDLQLLGAIDMEVERNAFGRQKQSFATKIVFSGWKKTIDAAFIRGPAIHKVWNNCEILAKTADKIVAVKQNEFLALSFHPELLGDESIYQYFYANCM